MARRMRSLTPRVWRSLQRVLDQMSFQMFEFCSSFFWSSLGFWIDFRSISPNPSLPDRRWRVCSVLGSASSGVESLSRENLDTFSSNAPLNCVLSLTTLGNSLVVLVATWKSAFHSSIYLPPIGFYATVCNHLQTDQLLINFAAVRILPV